MCIKCSDRAYFGDKGKCKLVDKDCRTYEEIDGKCTSCYGGYKLENGKCKKDEEESSCLERDGEGVCTKCIYKHFLNSENECEQVDDYCADFDYDEKECKGCYAGYSLLYGKCEITKV